MGMRYILAVLVSAALVSGCAASRQRLKVGITPEGEVVEAEGNCPVTGDLLSVRKCSLAEAQKSAVEKVIGVFISARTRVEKAVTIDQNILAKTDGYVKKYDILKEWTKDNFHHTKIRALIPPRSIEADINALLRSSVVGNPRVVVSLTERVDGAPVERPVAAHILAKALLAKGFQVMDQPVVGGPEGIDMAKSLQAEILIVGSADATFNTDQELGGLVSYRGNVNVQAMKAGTGEILLVSQDIKSGLDLNRTSAADKARENAAQGVAEKLTNELVKSLARKSGVTLSVTGISSISQLSELQKIVQAIPGVGDVYARSYESGQAVLDVETLSADSQAVAAGLERSTSLKLKVAGVHPDHLNASLAE